MATVKKLVELESGHRDWIKRTAKEFGMLERDVITAVFDHAISANIMAAYKKKVVVNRLENTLAQLDKAARNIATLQETAKEQIKQLEPSGTDGE